MNTTPPTAPAPARHRRRLPLAAASVMLASAWLTAAGASARDLTYTDLLHQLVDLDRLTHLQQGITAGQFSSWDRGERQSWGSNGDAGQYMRVEENGEAVMMDQDGPGCIFRIWSANPQGMLRIYLDGAATPTHEFDFNGMFTGENPPFIKPLVYKRGERQSGSDCYLPIPFARHIKISADQAHPQYYQIGYLRYPDDWRVPSFRLPLTAEEEGALKESAAAWASPGTDPKPKLPGQQTVQSAVTVRPGETVKLADLKGPGVVRAIRAKVDCSQRDFWRKLVLRAAWDGTDWPQVLAPLGPFFGFDWKTAEYGSLIAGCREGQCYFHYPMPFRQSAALELTSYLEAPADVAYEIVWAPVNALPEDTACFFARWRHERDSPTFDYPFLETAGRGHFVGVTLQVDHPVPGWWGEGDEKVWVDDDAFPNWIGTGSEDYFGDAWGIRYLPAPSFGCSFDQHPRTCPYRWHFMDPIPFSKRFRMTIENYGSWHLNHVCESEYSSVACWYQAELAPPFAELAGASYTGGTKMGEPPVQYGYRADVFADITRDDVRTSGLDIPFAREAEDVLQPAVVAGRARIITDALLPHEFNWERAADFGQVKAGDPLADFQLAAGAAGVYFPTLYTSPAEGLADLTLEVDGETLGTANRTAPNAAELDGVYLREGGQPARLLATTDGHAVIDCFQLQPAPRADGAIEAEDVEVVSAGGGEGAHPGKPFRGPSAGRILEWRAAAPGDAIVLRIPRAGAAAYVLGVRPMDGPDSGTIQAFAAGKPIGPRFDLYAPQQQLAPSVLPLGPLPAEGGDVEIRMVGRNAAATAYHAGLDYFRFEPLIIHPDSTQGIWAQVLKTQGCEYRIQDLGPAFVGGHHLWIQPSDRNAFVDIGLNIETEGDYDITVRYTTSWDYATVQASLDDKPVGERVDLWTTTVQQTEPLDLGRFHLTAGQHVIRFQAVDKNEQSRGYLMGIDYVLVR